MNPYTSRNTLLLTPLAAFAAIFSINPASAAPIGFNFHGTRPEFVLSGQVESTETAYGVSGANWHNIQITGEGNPNFTVNQNSSTATLDGHDLTISWHTGSLFNNGTDLTSAAPEARVLKYFATNLAGANGNDATFTISGLSGFPGGYTVKIIGAQSSGTSFNPVTVSSDGVEQSLAFGPLSGVDFPPAGSSAIAGITPASQTFTGDSLTITTAPNDGGLVSGIAAIVIEPPSAINTFDDDAELDDWEVLPGPTGAVTIDHSFDLQPRFVDDIQHTPHSEGLWSTDADGSLTSGSLKIEAVHTETSGNQFDIRRNFAEPVDASSFETLELDILFDPASTRRRFGNYSWFTISLQYLDGEETKEVIVDSWNPLGTQTNSQGGGIPGSENGPEDYPNQWNWQRITAPLQTETVIPALSAVTGIRITSTHSGNSAPSAVAYLDNLRFTVPEAPSTDDPGPQLAIEKADSGLLLTLAAADPETTLGTGQYQNIRTAAGDYTWVGRATAENPVTYSFTIAGYPSTPAGATGQFESHIFLIPAVEGYDWTHNPNITHPHAVRLTLNGDASTAWAHLAYKIDYPDGDGYWTADNGLGGQLGSVGRPSVHGTWSLRFTADNVVTLVSPNGATQTWTIVMPDYTGIEDAPPTVADAFAGPMAVYFGSGVRDAQGLHHLEARASALFGGISITGVPQPVNETFAGPLDPELFSLEASTNPAAVIPLNLTPSPFWVTWNRSATGHRLQESADLGGWTDSETSITGPLGDRQRVLKPAWLRPAGKGFYRLTDE